MADIKRYMIPWTGKLIEKDDGDYVLHSDHEAAIKAAVAAEREAIALMVESHCWIYPELPPTRFVRLVAKAIRARGAAHDQKEPK